MNKDIFVVIYDYIVVIVFSQFSQKYVSESFLCPIYSRFLLNYWDISVLILDVISWCFIDGAEHTPTQYWDIKVTFFEIANYFENFEKKNDLKTLLGWIALEWVHERLTENRYRFTGIIRRVEFWHFTVRIKIIYWINFIHNKVKSPTVDIRHNKVSLCT